MPARVVRRVVVVMPIDVVDELEHIAAERGTTTSLLVAMLGRALANGELSTLAMQLEAAP